MNFFRRLFGGRSQEEPSVESREAEAKVLQILDANLRKASIAQIGGFEPSNDPLASWFGGHAVALPSEPYPEYDGKPMYPLLQVNCSELPYLPPQLEETALFVVWISDDAIGVLAEEEYDKGFLVREYKTLDGLVPVDNRCDSRTVLAAGVRSKHQEIKTLPIKWQLVEDDAPDWGDAWDITDLSPLEEIDEDYSEKQYDQRYTNYDRTKIGGYPTPIQNTLSESDANGTFVFQIASEEKANWDWVDAGVAYFFKDENGKWEWDCQFS